jgi:hypothetical protein
VNLIDRAPTAMALIAIAIASKLFDTAARKHTIGVDTMSQVRECGRSLSLAGAEEEGRSRSLELSVNQVARPGGHATTGSLVISTGFCV